MINCWPVILPDAGCAVHLRWITPVLPRLSPDSSMLCTLAVEVLVQLWVLAFCAVAWKIQSTGVKVCREVGKSWFFCARKRMSCSFQTLNVSTWNLKAAFNSVGRKVSCSCRWSVPLRRIFAFWVELSWLYMKSASSCTISDGSEGITSPWGFRDKSRSMLPYRFSIWTFLNRICWVLSKRPTSHVPT